jgi:hypothetical protein
VVYVDHEAIWDRMVLAPTFIDFCRSRENPERRYRSWRQGHSQRETDLRGERRGRFRGMS